MQPVLEQKRQRACVHPWIQSEPDHCVALSKHDKAGYADWAHHARLIPGFFPRRPDSCHRRRHALPCPINGHQIHTSPNKSVQERRPVLMASLCCVLPWTCPTQEQGIRHISASQVEHKAGFRQCCAMQEMKLSGSGMSSLELNDKPLPQNRMLVRSCGHTSADARLSVLSMRACVVQWIWNDGMAVLYNTFCR